MQYDSPSIKVNCLIQGRGKMAELIRAYDWSQTHLGPICQWPPSLKANVELILQTPIAMTLLWGKEGMMIYNDAYAIFSGAKHPENLGKPILEAWPEASGIIHHFMDSGFEDFPITIHQQQLTLYRNGEPEEVWADLYYSPILGEDGQVIGILSTVIDVTLRIKEEIARKEAQERLYLAFEATQDGVWDWDFKQDKAWWDERFTQIIGVDIPEAERSLDALIAYIHPEDREIIPKALKAHLEHGERYEFAYRLVSPSGEIRHVLSKGKAILDEFGNMTKLTGTFSDITERRQAEEALKESEARFRNLADTAPVGIWLANEEAQVTFWNQVWLDYTGLTFEEALGTAWVNMIHPDDYQALHDTYTASVKARTPFTIEVRYKGKTGHYNWYLANGGPRYMPDGSFVGFIGTLSNINERKQAEESLLEYKDKLERSNRELEQFATVASHDLKAPLRKISTFIGALQHLEGNKLSEEGQDYLMRINKSVDKMNSLMTDLLALSRVNRHGKPFSPVELKDVLIEVLANLRPYQKEVSGNIEIGETFAIEGDEFQLNQLFQNLIANALKFHRQNVPPLVKVACLKLSNGNCAITVADNGIGLKMENAEKIFEVFERIRGQQAYEGTGIGLAIVKKIVERHNGTIQVDSELGKGTTFTVILPIKQA